MIERDTDPMQPFGRAIPNPSAMARGYNPYIVFWANEFERIIGDNSPANAKAYVEREMRAVKDAAGYKWANDHIRASTIIAGHEFNFSIYLGKGGDGVLYTWVDDGTTSVGSYILVASDYTGRDTARTARREVARQAMADIDRWLGGREYRCSSCREWFAVPAAGRFFAGRYCAECWIKPGPNGSASIKDREARETYE